jgi:type I restriction enzyme S subunit
VIPGWSTATIGESCAVFSGGTPSKGNQEYWRGSIPWVSAKDLKFDRISGAALHISEEACKDSATKIAPVGALLVLVRGMGLANGVPIGEVMSPVAFNQDIRAIVPPESVIPRFLALALRYSITNGGGRNLLSSAAHGTLKIDSDVFHQLTYPVPPLAEQKRILAILDGAFEGIATARENAEKNLQNSRELFEAHLASAFSSQGDLVPLSECATDISDGDHAPPPKSPAGVPFITISNVNKETRRIDFSDTFTVSRQYYESLKPHRKPRPGDVLYTVTGSFGIPILVEDEREFCFQRHIGLIRPKPNVDSQWLTYALLAPQVREQAEAGATGTAQRTVSLGVLRGITIPKTSYADQLVIAAQLATVSEAVQRLKKIAQAKMLALDNLKMSLLRQAFNGFM